MSHHHHHKNSASSFKERSLNAIVLRRKIEKGLKILLLIIAIFMVGFVAYLYLIG